MRSIDVVQACYGCGYQFIVRYFEDGSYLYLEPPCNCDDEFFAHGPSLSQWLESLKN